MDAAALLEAVRAIVPPLTGENYKGQHGKVGVVGGCREYTGAPYFAAQSALRVGADLSWVFCTQSAGPTVKSYSPELIVLPVLLEKDVFGKEALLSDEELIQRSVAAIKPWLSKLNCLVVGPGLGEDPLVVAVACELITAARASNLPLLVDGSGMNVVAARPQLVAGYQRCILTPNVAELGRMAKGVGIALEGKMTTAWQEHAQEVARRLQGPVVVSKGPTDIITDGATTLLSDEPCSLRRAGGQGDVMAGTIATFVGWAQAAAARAGREAEAGEAGGQSDEIAGDARQPASGGGGEVSGSGGGAAAPPAAASEAAGVSPMMLAAYGGSLLMRKASARAFAAAGRSMVAGDVLAQLPAVVRETLEG